MIFNLGLMTTTLAGLGAALPHSVVQTRDNGNSSSAGGGSGGSGGVNIINNMNSNIYAFPVSSTSGEMKTLTANGGTYNEPWQTNSNGGGVSIKLSMEPNQDDVLQFEYTEGGDTIFWDMSCINMGSDSKFTKAGFSVQPSQNSDNCPSVNCHAGDKDCADAYLQPKDDHATHGCPIDTQFTVNIGN